MRDSQEIAWARHVCWIAAISEIHFDGDHCRTIRFQSAAAPEIMCYNVVLWSYTGTEIHPVVIVVVWLDDGLPNDSGQDLLDLITDMHLGN